MKRLVILLITIILHNIAQSQINGAYVSNFYLTNNAENWCWSINQDTDGNMLFGVSKALIVFDGTNQTNVKTPFTPLVILCDTVNNTYFLGGYEQIGKVTKSVINIYNYQEIGSYTNQQFKSIKTFGNFTYFISDEMVVALNNSTNESKIISEADIYIDQIIDYNQKLYLIIDYSLFELNQDKLQELKNFNLPVDDFSYNVNTGSNFILGTQLNTYYKVDKSSVNTFEIAQNNYFENNLIVDGKLFNETTIILSSLASGIAIFDISKQRIIKQINYFNGLPDDEIRSLFIDKDNGIWVSHEFGISRIDFQVGIEEYNYFPGLKGNPIAVKNFDNVLYVATNDGLFTLDAINDYNEFEVNVNVPVNVKVEKQIKTREIEASTESDNKFLRKKKRKDRKELDSSDDAKKEKPYVNKRKYVKKTIKKRSLKSVNQYYKMVNGMNGKYRQLVRFNNYLLAAGNNGIYAIKDRKPELILKDAYINDVFIDKKNNLIYACTSDGIYKLSNLNNKWNSVHFFQLTNENILSIAHEKDNLWVYTTGNRVVRAKLVDNKVEILHNIEMPEEPGRVFIVKNINNVIQIFTAQYKYTLTQNGEIKLDGNLFDNSSLIYNQPDYVWVADENGYSIISNNPEPISDNLIKTLNLSKNIRYIDVNPDGSIWYINTKNQISRILPTAKGKTNNFSLGFQSVSIGNKQIEPQKEYALSAHNNLFKINLEAPFFLSQNGVQYSYKINGYDTDWSKYSNNNTIEIKYLPPGTYTLQYKAKNLLGEVIEGESITITIAKPFIQTIWFYLLLLIGFIVIAHFFSKFRNKKLEKDKRILEQKVKERTQTIEIQKNRIEKQHSEITQSIRYAQRIQKAMLPLDEIMDAMLPNHFILFMPRDIVSGDFYFFKPLGRFIVFVAADCTGHGVPGGFMSMLGISYLSEITSQLSPSTTAAEVINHLREKIKITLGQTSIESAQKDGMDLSICLIDTDNKKIQFAGAFNPLIILRNGEIEIIKADRQPVSVYFKEEEFTNHIIDVQQGDKFYMFSDGFQDQIGGPKTRKFMVKKFKELLLDIHTHTMDEQKAILEQTINDWKGDMMQVDDILVIGFEL